MTLGRLERDGLVEVVDKTSGGDAAGFLARQRASHLRRIRELRETPADDDPTSPLVREYTVAHLNADLRWLDSALDRIAEQRETSSQ